MSPPPLQPPPLRCDRLRTVGAAINQMSGCVQGPLLLSIRFDGERLCDAVWHHKRSRGDSQTQTIVPFSHFISRKFIMSHFLKNPTACNCWLSNKLMADLITLLCRWQCIGTWHTRLHVSKTHNLRCPSGKEPIESIWKGTENLKGDMPNLLSITF